MFRLLKDFIIFIFCAGLAFAGWIAWAALVPLEMKTQAVDFSIKPGSSLFSAGKQIKEAGVDLNLFHFRLLGKMLRSTGNIKAGNYQIEKGTTALDLLSKLTKGNVTLIEIAFIEGWTFRQMRNLLDGSNGIKHDSALMSEAEILRQIGATETVAEGLFFPDTYLYSQGASDLSILKRAYRAMKKQLAQAWELRDASVPYATPYEALIMASIVEKETGQANERDMIAGVFVNRLKMGMLLQTDPTVIYGLGEKFDGNLRKVDLLTDTPYNTYTRKGLPPTPIAMPGLASLRSALKPAKTNAIYFVARGNGTSQFSSTLAEHNRAVAKYQLKIN